MLCSLSFAFFVIHIGCLIDTVNVPDSTGSPTDTTPTTSAIVYHPHKHMAAMATFLQHQPITIMVGKTVHVSTQRGHFGCVSLSETVLITIVSLWLLFSWSGITGDTAMAIMLPSWLKEREEMSAGYLWNWHSLFLLKGSQILTNPSEPPAHTHTCICVNISQ